MKWFPIVRHSLLMWHHWAVETVPMLVLTLLGLAGASCLLPDSTYGLGNRCYPTPHKRAQGPEERLTAE